MKTFRLIIACYKTDEDGASFIELTEYRHEKKWKVKINWCYDLPQHTTDQASVYLTKQGFNIIGVSELQKGYAIITDTYYDEKENFLYLK